MWFQFYFVNIFCRCPGSPLDVRTSSVFSVKGISSRCCLQVAGDVNLFFLTEGFSLLSNTNIDACNSEDSLSPSVMHTIPLSAPWNLKASSWKSSLFSAGRDTNFESEPVILPSSRHLDTKKQTK